MFFGNSTQKKLLDKNHNRNMVTHLWKMEMLYYDFQLDDNPPKTILIFD